MKVNRNREKERKKSHFALWIFGAVLASFMLSFFLGQSGMLRLRQLKADSEEMQKENHRLAVENRALMLEIRKLREDPAMIEKIAREELHYVSPDDLVLLVPDKRASTN